MAVPKDLVAASATPLILSILAEGDSYGYAIIGRVKELSGGQMAWTDGMLYPVLHRLEKQGLVESYVRPSETGRKRKYYRLKRQGTKALAEHKSQWMLVHNTLQQLWERKACLT
jgi:DNA-binding PadR family transcriptional regulator